MSDADAPTDEMTWLRERLEAMTPPKWRGRAFSDGRGGVWAESSAAVFTCPNVEHADMAGVAYLRNLAPAMLAVIEAVEEGDALGSMCIRHAEFCEHPCTCDADIQRLREALDAFRTAVREEQGRC